MPVRRRTRLQARFSIVPRSLEISACGPALTIAKPRSGTRNLLLANLNMLIMTSFHIAEKGQRSSSGRSVFSVRNERVTTTLRRVERLPRRPGSVRTNAHDNDKGGDDREKD